MERITLVFATVGFGRHKYGVYAFFYRYVFNSINQVTVDEFFSYMMVWYIMYLVSTGVFAISGALSALNIKMYHDMFGLFFIGFLTAVGVCILRDVITGAYPVAWIPDPNYLIVILSSVMLAILCRRWWLGRLQRLLLVFNTIGAGSFTTQGMRKTMARGLMSGHLCC